MYVSWTAVQTTTLEKHLPDGGKAKISGIIEKLVALIEAAKEKNGAIWPEMTDMAGKPLSGASVGGDKNTKFDESTEEKVTNNCAVRVISQKHPFSNTPLQTTHPALCHLDPTGGSQKVHDRQIRF